MQSDKISVLLAGSEPDMGEDLQQILKNQATIDVVGSSDSKERILELAEKLEPEVIVIDYDFAGDGLQASKQLLKISPSSKIIVLSIYDHVGRVDVHPLPEETNEAIDSIEWLSKNTTPAKLLEAVSHPNKKGKKRSIQ
jgi:chemotaxis response regulator CheB